MLLTPVQPSPFPAVFHLFILIGICHFTKQSAKYAVVQWLWIDAKEYIGKRRDTLSPDRVTLCDSCEFARSTQLPAERNVVSNVAHRLRWVSPIKMPWYREIPRSMWRDRFVSAAQGAVRPIVVVPPVLPQWRSCPMVRTSLTALGRLRSVVCHDRELPYIPR